MFVLVWTTLLFSTRGSKADAAAPMRPRRSCQNGFCITLTEGEIRAQAGLCVVIPCSFTPGPGYTPKHLVWYKCEQSKPRCSDSDIIFHTNKNNVKVDSGFKGRVSLLEPDVNKETCSIVINDLTVSDSGSYQLRLNSLNRWNEQVGFTFPVRAVVSVKDLTQRPTVMTPRLIEGQQTTLTCTAPGLCSGSAPKISWRWRSSGEKDSHITGNITDVKTENLTDATQRHSSTLTFKPSAQHHGTNVTCEVSFINSMTAEETVTLNVTYVKEVKITGNTSVKEGDALNLTCSVESFPPSLITWIKLPEKNMRNVQHDPSTDLQNDTKTCLQDRGLCTFSISNVTKDDSGQYICIVNHLNSTLTKKADVAVIYLRKPVISGNTTVKAGDSLSLTCSVESYPPSHISWTVRGSNTNLLDRLLNNTGSTTLVIPNVTAEHSGQYVCTARHIHTTAATHSDVFVTWFSKILKSSRCEVQSEVLTCVCVSEGFPLPSIKWPLLKNQSQYAVITSVSNHSVNSTVTLKGHRNTSVECVSRNENGEAKETLAIRENTSANKDQSVQVLKIVSRLEVIVAFVTGVILSAFVCCLVKKCHRKKQKIYGNLDETLEMVTSPEDPLINGGQAVEDNQTYYQEVAVAAEKAAPDLDGEAKDVQYASIDFSLLKRKSHREAVKMQESTETEYAEIKREVKEEKQDDGEEEDEVSEGEDRDVVTGENEEMQHFVPEEEEGDDVAVYSNVKNVMDDV